MPLADHLGQLPLTQHGMGDVQAGVLDLLKKHFKSGKADFNLYDTNRWQAVADHLLEKSGGKVTPVLREVIERGGQRLVQSKDFVAKLEKLKLYEVSLRTRVLVALRMSNGRSENKKVLRTTSRT